MTPIAIVIDRPTAARAVEEIRALGGYYREMFDMWRVMDTPYLVFLAHTRQRINLRAPLTYMPATDDGLRIALKMACAELSGRVMWNLIVEKGSAADVITRAELLIDTVPEGSA